MDALGRIFRKWLIFLAFRHAWVARVFTDLNFYFVNVVFKVTFLLVAIWEYHFTIAMLDASNPLTLIAASIRPVHLPVAISLVILVLSLVHVTTCPLEHPIPVLLVSVVVPLVTVALRSSSTPPLSFTFLHPCFEIPNIARAIGPGVLTLAVWLTINILSCIGVPVYKDISASAVLQAEIPLAFIPISIFPGVNAVAVGFALVPFTNVRVIEQAPPDAIAMFETNRPFTIIDFSIYPSIHSLTIGFAHFEIAEVRISVGISLESFAVSQVFFPQSLILSAICIFHHTFAMTLSLNHDSQVNCIRKPSLLEVWVFLQLVEIDLIRFKYDLVKLEGGLLGASSCHLING